MKKLENRTVFITGGNSGSVDSGLSSVDKFRNTIKSPQAQSATLRIFIIY